MFILVPLTQGTPTWYKYQALAVTTDCNVVIQSQFAWYYITTYFQFHKSKTYVLSIYAIRKLNKNKCFYTYYIYKILLLCYSQNIKEFLIFKKEDAQ